MNPWQAARAFEVLDDVSVTPGIADLRDESIREFLSDENIDISDHTIHIIDKKKIDDKAALYRNRHKKKIVSDIIK